MSTWLVYADGIRRLHPSRAGIPGQRPARETAVGARASTASLRTDLELTRQDNRALRAEIVRLKHALRDNLGRQLDEESTHHLCARVDELTAANEQIQNHDRTPTADRDALQAALDATDQPPHPLSPAGAAARRRRLITQPA